MPPGPKVALPDIDRALFPTSGATELETAKEIAETASTNGNTGDAKGALPTTAPTALAGSAFGNASAAAPAMSTGAAAVPTQASDPGVTREIVPTLHAPDTLALQRAGGADEQRHP